MKKPNVPLTSMYDIPSTPSTSQYCGPLPPPPQPQVPPQQRQMPPQQFAPGRFNNVHQWQQNHFDSGIQSMQGSSNPSMMSYAESQMSMASVMSETPQNNLSDQNLAKIERVRTFFTGGETDKSKEAIPELLKLLDDDEEEVVEKAIDVLKNVARSDNWRPQGVAAVIDRDSIVFSVKQTMCRYKNNKYIVRCCFCILFFTPEQFLVPLVKHCKEEILNALISGISISEYSTYKYAIMNIHNLIKQKELGPSVIQYLRDQKAIGFIAEWLKDTTIKDKLLSIIVDCINHICNKNEEERSFFVVNLGGIEKLLAIMSQRAYPPLILNICSLLFSIAASDTSQPVYSKRIVEAGVFSVVHRHLPMHNGNTLIWLLKMILSLSDIAGNLDVKPLLAQLINFIRHPDLRIKQLSIDSLSNLIANKGDLKDFVAQNNAVQLLIQLMEQIDNVEGENKMKVEKVQEAALTVLSHLCSQHPNAEGVVFFIPQTSLRVILLEKLVQLRPAVLKQALILLSKLLVDPRNVRVFKETWIVLSGEERWYIPAICHVLGISFQQMGEAVEGVKISSLMRVTLDVLTHFSKDKSVAELVVQHFVQSGPFYPAQILTIDAKGNEDLKPVKLSALKMLFELSACGYGAKFIASNDFVKESLGHVKNSEIDDLVRLADRVLERALETSLNPPPPTYRIVDQQHALPEFVAADQPYHSPSQPVPDPYYYPQHQSQYPPVNAPNRPPFYDPSTGYPLPPSGPMYPHPGGQTGYDYGYQTGYPAPGSCYDSQPMSMGNMPASAISSNEEHRHEELEYIHPVESVQNVAYQQSGVHMDQDYSMTVPQSSPFHPAALEPIHWDWKQ